MRPALSNEHLADLRKSGLTDETIEQARVYSVPAHLMAQKLGRVAKKIKSALAFPYRDGFERYKLFPALKTLTGHTLKYFQPRGSGVHLYIPPWIYSSLSGSKAPLYITEGEKKALRAAQEGLCCVAIAGLWNWKRKGEKGAISDIKELPLAGRQVLIVPDSDTALRFQLFLAVCRFAVELEKLKALVEIIQLPAYE